MLDKRDEFLIHLYDQLWNSINARITGMWQSISVLAGSIALLALSEKGVIPIDIAVTLIILCSGWLLGNILNTSFWYNRNLTIITNIERQFLKTNDTREIHWYVGRHLSANKMIRHLKIQFIFGMSILSIFLIYHFITVVLPGFKLPFSCFQPIIALPYITLLCVLLSLMCYKHKFDSSWEEFIKKSPGKELED